MYLDAEIGKPSTFQGPGPAHCLTDFIMPPVVSDLSGSLSFKFPSSLCYCLCFCLMIFIFFADIWGYSQDFLLCLWPACCLPSLNQTLILSKLYFWVEDTNAIGFRVGGTNYMLCSSRYKIYYCLFYTCWKLQWPLFHMSLNKAVL